jgi:LPXTG-motif cell wall-anchored protein
METIYIFFGIAVVGAVLLAFAAVLAMRKRNEK